MYQMWNQSPSPGFKFRPRKGVWTDGQNNVFDPNEFEATSYNWWTYVKRIKGKVVFNEYPYSQTTSNHQRNMRTLLKQLKIKIDVTVSMRQSLSNFYNDSLPSKYETLFKLEIQATRARKGDTSKVDAIKSVKSEIKLCRSLGAKFTRKQMSELKADVIRRDEARLKAAREERAEVKAKRDALKPLLTDLGEVSLKVFEDVSDLNEIELNQNKEVSNA